ncbi:hypothetical protein CDEST_03542 [Colletotrichum destructivum]|uniref:Uncharacterized protein n=1 Tax=Colletotrichum destructivum TaxID=34406 RepID=A0AAX4I596_9PEZI|nr:hypothetical protein CDEST_03542 [Colletotrichum destructivum]
MDRPSSRFNGQANNVSDVIQGGSSFSGNLTLSHSAQLHQGNIINIQQTNNSLFSAFKEVQINEQAFRSLYRTGRGARGPLSFIQPSAIRYMPYANIGEGPVRTMLYKIARDFQLIDAGFAEFYRVAVPYNELVSAELKSIRDRYYHGVANNHGYLGSLGVFLELATDMKKTQPREIPLARFAPENYGERALEYLQDGFEVPYWVLLCDIFVPYCESGELDNAAKFYISHTINSVQLQTRARLQKLETDYSYELPKEITNGIKWRLDVLEDMTGSISTNLGDEWSIHAHSFQPTQLPSSVATEPTAIEPPSAVTIEVTSEEGSKNIEKVESSALFILFFALAIIPACLGFDRHSSPEPGEEAIGKALDADFMWLIAGNLLALLGNIFAVLPLWRLTRGSTAHLVTQGLILLSTVLGVASVTSYCFVNKGWSSLMSFFSNFFAISGVYFSTMHVSIQSLGGVTRNPFVKVKND